MNVEKVEFNNHKNQDPYLTTTDFSKVVGVSRFTVINWAKKGHIRTQNTVGGHSRIHLNDAIDFLGHMQNKQALKCAHPYCWENAKEHKCDHKCSRCFLDGKPIADCSLIVKLLEKHLSKDSAKCHNCEFKNKFLCDSSDVDNGNYIKNPENGEQAKENNKNILFNTGHHIGGAVRNIVDKINRIKGRTDDK
ncbi:MAG: hypothetical protein HQL29_06370 [Candidatus Omnitrophica bacterium]|nr:hypothetical protein [Candidatus Omnitrophota bacterium]